MLRALPVVLMLLLLPLGACKELPSAETDEMVRAMRSLDRAHRPGGGDLPMERYVAWSAARDAGLKPARELDDELRALVDEQKALVGRLRKLRTPSSDALRVYEAYLTAHQRGYEAMEDVLSGRLLKAAASARAAEDRIHRALEQLRAARKLRADLEQQLGVSGETT